MLKTIASMSLMIVGVVGSAVIIMQASTALTKAEQPHPFTNLSTPPLWTSQPVRIDPAATHLERLPPEYSTYALAAPVQSKTQAVAMTAPKVEEQRQENLQPSDEHVAWCIGKYRSYDASRNSYRSFDGSTHACAEPSDAAAVIEGGTALAQESVDWCSNRYKSYRSSDNSYQPLDGGPRRVCAPPRIVADASTAG